MTQNHQKIFIDEVQRLPSVLNTIQVLIDHDPQKQFFLRGSSARKLRRGEANLLPCRVLSFELGPLTLNELKEDFNLEKALSLGLLPGVYLSNESSLAKKLLSSYAATYLKQEVQAEALTRNLEGFARFFSVIASKNGEFLDFSKFSSEAMIRRTTAVRYFDILVNTLVLQPVEAFSKSSSVRLVQHPKYYFFDMGVWNGALNNFLVSVDRIGKLFENLFLQLVVSEARSQGEAIRVSTYRTNAGAEVNFIIEKGNQLFAVEVRASKNFGKHDLTGLKSFAKFYSKPHVQIVANLGDFERSVEDIIVLPLKKALDSIFSK